MDGGRRRNVKLEEIVYGASTAFEPPAKLNSWAGIYYHHPIPFLPAAVNQISDRHKYMIPESDWHSFICVWLVLDTQLTLCGLAEANRGVVGGRFYEQQPHSYYNIVSAVPDPRVIPVCTSDKHHRDHWRVLQLVSWLLLKCRRVSSFRRFFTSSSTRLYTLSNQITFIKSTYMTEILQLECDFDLSN